MTQGARILVVDDEPQIRRSLQVNLERSGYAVETVETGLQALDSFQNRRPDVIILDLVMPGMNGEQVVRRIRDSSSVPIIVLSAIGEESRKVEALEQGADDYMTKPFGMEELLARIRSVLRRAAGAHDLGAGAAGLLRPHRPRLGGLCRLVRDQGARLGVGVPVRRQLRLQGPPARRAGPSPAGCRAGRPRRAAAGRRPAPNPSRRGSSLPAASGSSSSRLLPEPLGATQMGLIYVNG